MNINNMIKNFCIYFIAFCIMSQSLYAYNKNESIRIIQQAFFQILERPVCKDEFDFYYRKLNQENWTTKELITYLIFTKEHFQRFYLGKKCYIYKLYQHILNKKVPDSICNKWVIILNNLEKKHGLTKALKIIALNLIESSEYSNRFGIHIVPHY